MGGDEFEAPRHIWVPSIAPSGLIRYQGNRIPGWEGSLLSGALAKTHLNRVVLAGNQFRVEERLPLGWGWRVMGRYGAPPQD